MGSLLLDQIKKQTTTFLQEKFKTARITFTDVTEVELLAEEATNKDDCSPDAKTMTRIAEASFDVDEYWRIVDVLHRRLYTIDWVQWRQSYKALILLEFLLTHGPEEFAQEFQCDVEIIEELGNFTHIDGRGFDWGARMQKLSDQVLKLLQGGEPLREARLKALKLTTEIQQGFGSSLNSPSSSSSPYTPSSDASPRSLSSFCSFSTDSSTTTPAFMDSNEHLNKESNIVFQSKNVVQDKDHHWDGPAGEEGHVFVNDSDDNEEGENVDKAKGFVSGIYSKIVGNGEKIGYFRCISDVGTKGTNKKKFDRQHSLWF
ncbi:hypothetical protein RIF29_21566 [Crotalaria pallida]|uniref:ENTH domain-containing protein n=1 Tax=Crotalaria pallida TaxID=3830 RepID=A0AAN9F372_CROPI